MRGVLDGVPSPGASPDCAPPRRSSMFASIQRSGPALVFLYGLIVALLYRPLSQQEAGDAAIWDYLAQSILRGQVLYRDVIEIKGPGSAYLSAVAMLAGRFFGLRDLFAVRLLQVAAVGLLLSIVYLLAERLLLSRLAALVASLVPLISDYFVGWMGQGTQPKLWMILFGLLSMLFVAKEKPFLAGLLSMLSCLCWQPGLLFTGTAFLIFSRYLTKWRDLRAARVVAGAAVALVAVVLYFYLVGSLRDLWMWTIVYNAKVYGPEGIRGPGESLVFLWNAVYKVFRARAFFVALAALGMFGVGIEVLRLRLGRNPAMVSRFYAAEAVLLASLVYIVFCLIDFQSGPDLIPFFPFLGLFAAWPIAKACDLSARLASDRMGLSPMHLNTALQCLSAAVVLVFVLYPAWRFRPAPEETLHYQEEHLGPISNLLAPGDSIYVNGAVELLVLLDRPNAVPSIMLDRGKGDFLAAMKYHGSFDSIIEEIESKRPKLVALYRLAHVEHRAELERWTEEHFDKQRVGDYSLYVRRQDQK